MTGNNWAIVVGINEYEHLPADDHLKYAVKDALAMQAFLCDQAQFPADNVLVCCDPQVTGTRRPSRSGLRDLLKNKLQPARGADNFWFFYAGHGIVHNHQDFLLPCDGNPYDLEETALPISFVTDYLRDCEAHNVVLVLDMCRNRTRSVVEDGSRDVSTGMGEQTLELAKAQGMVTLFSCSRGQRSYELADLEQGAFTHTLLAGLQESTTPRVLEQYLTNRLPALNQRYGKPVQVPLVVPEPGWKYDRPLLLSAATPFDLSLLKEQARDAELEEDYDWAESLWWQVIEADQSTPSDRVTARKAISRMGVKRRASVQPQTQIDLAQPVQPEPEPQPQPESKLSQRTQNESSQTRPTTPVLQPFEFDVVTVNAEGQETSRKRGQAQSFTEDLGNGVRLEMVAIPGATFLMGSPAGEGEYNKASQHSVTVPPFFMGKYAVTQEQWRAVAALPKLKCDLEPAPAKFKGAKRPVEKVSWHEAVEFCARLSHRTGRQYRLPSEAEWEYACRAETTTPFHCGEALTTDLANYDNNRGQTTDVGCFPPNAFGLYDLHGNVWEWCLDRRHTNYQGAPTDGSAWVTGGDSERRVIRGGSWSNSPRDCRSDHRDAYPSGYRINGIGFRVVCAALGTP